MTHRPEPDPRSDEHWLVDDDVGVFNALWKVEPVE